MYFPIHRPLLRGLRGPQATQYSPRKPWSMAASLLNYIIDLPMRSEDRTFIYTIVPTASLSLCWFSSCTSSVSSVSISGSSGALDRKSGRIEADEPDYESTEYIPGPSPIIPAIYTRNNSPAHKCITPQVYAVIGLILYM